jgi:hypothetical protein
MREPKYNATQFVRRGTRKTENHIFMLTVLLATANHYSVMFYTAFYGPYTTTGT